MSFEVMRSTPSGSKEALFYKGLRRHKHPTLSAEAF